MRRRTRGSRWATPRQWRYPRAIRITGRDAPEDLGRLLDAAREAVRTAGEPPPAAASTPAVPASAEAAVDDATLADVATGLWRARRRMLDPETGEPKPEMLRPFRPVQTTWDTLADAGVTIQDHDGERYVEGQTIRVLAFQEVPGLRTDEVVETVLPTVYVGGRIIQLGEVLVGTPGDQTGPGLSGGQATAAGTNERAAAPPERGGR